MLILAYIVAVLTVIKSCAKQTGFIEREMLICRDICVKLRTEHDGKPRYLRGQKRCQHCACFIEYEGYRCPCCRSILRTRPRHVKEYEGKDYRDAKRID